MQATPKTEACPVCGKDLQPGEPVAWGLANQRLHERCLDGLRAARLRPTERAQNVAPAVRSVLSRHEGRLCVACLAMEINASLEQAREVARRLVPGEGFALLPVDCGRCGRETDVLCTI